MLRRTWLPVLPVLLVLVGSAFTPAADAQPSPSNTTTAGARSTAITTYDFEARLLTLTNQRRARVGCGAMVRNVPMVRAARGHSSRMAYARQLSHRLSGEAYFSTRIVRAGYTPWRILAENIAWGSPSPTIIFNSWMRSAMHRQNIDNCRLRDIGLGVSYGGGYAWVTMDLGHH
ncbi:MAG: hypothetical protein J7518_21985 [Nocardioidaceae bacterium]|nr:hypothetical protein [Nocardioidaceae bacterium]